ncbi:hypothetical protein MAJ_10554, partial [Metarhizium majus ARSEF 297]
MPRHNRHTPQSTFNLFSPGSPLRIRHAELGMAYNSTVRSSAQLSEHHTIPSMPGHSSSQNSPFRGLEPAHHHEQSQHQTAERTVADSEADSDVSLSDNVASEATNSTVITPEDYERISREYEEAVRETHHRQMGCHSGKVSALWVYIQLHTLTAIDAVSQGSRNAAQMPRETNGGSNLGKRKFSAKHDESQRSDAARKLKARREEPKESNRGNSEGQEAPSTFIASIRTWSKTAGKRHPSNIYFQVEGFADVKRDEGGNIKIKVNWVPIWVPIQDLRGEESYDAARELVVGKFGEDAWTSTSDGWDAMEPYAEGRIDYAKE